MNKFNEKENSKNLYVKSKLNSEIFGSKNRSQKIKNKDLCRSVKLSDICQQNVKKRFCQDFSVRNVQRQIFSKQKLTRNLMQKMIIQQQTKLPLISNFGELFITTKKMYQQKQNKFEKKFDKFIVHKEINLEDVNIQQIKNKFTIDLFKILDVEIVDQNIRSQRYFIILRQNIEQDCISQNSKIFDLIKNQNKIFYCKNSKNQFEFKKIMNQFDSQSYQRYYCSDNLQNIQKYIKIQKDIDNNLKLNICIESKRRIQKFFSVGSVDADNVKSLYRKLNQNFNYRNVKKTSDIISYEQQKQKKQNQNNHRYIKKQNGYYIKPVKKNEQRKQPQNKNQIEQMKQIFKSTNENTNKFIQKNIKQFKKTNN